MNALDIFKALGNPARLQILAWLKSPEIHFPEQPEPFTTGVCVGQIHKKSELTQSTISENLAVLQRADLVISTRKGQWIYYRRNEETIKKLGNLIGLI